MTPPIHSRLALLFSLSITAAAPAEIILTADLTHDQEATQGTFTTSTGAPRPQSFGTASFTLNDAQTQMTFTATIFNVDVTGTQTADTFDNLRAAHIHAAAPPNVSAPVVWGFFGAPDNDNNPHNLIVTPFVDGVGGTFSSTWDAPEGNNTTLAAQLSNILSGQSYINFHTVQFPAGEIRGQITPVPEPTTLLLLAAGATALLRRQRPA